ncbi:MAG: ABC transporter substrate-binding protein [Acidobacteria bacterium]|nr:ABC transporter substrate-binding protein [Acidobacteriota bacterium]
MTTATETRTITVAHSPDSDDAFMFYGLATNKIETGELKYEHVLEDIQTLNEKARRGVYDVTAVSFHAYSYISDDYVLLPHGASIGDGYGPIVVAREPYRTEDLARLKIAVPGTLTSAFLALRILCPDFEYVVVPFDQIIKAVQDGRADAGLLIHEGQLFYQNLGLHKVVDLGEWWKDWTSLPLPMGGNVIRRELGAELIRRISGHLHESIRFSPPKAASPTVSEDAEGSPQRGTRNEKQKPFVFQFIVHRCGLLPSPSLTIGFAACGNIRRLGGI